MKKSKIFVPRSIYKPFEYENAYNFWLQHQQAHWIHTEVPMSSDVHDFTHNLTTSERNVITNILKLFTQTEVLVNDYWSRKVSKWFPKPEIAMMSSVFANAETIHEAAYAYLNDSLGLTDYQAFIEEPSMKTKIDYLLEARDNSISSIAKSIAIFSAFTEGVSLFSSFAVLMSFSRRNLLKGISQIVSWSVRDESQHSTAGCWLFRQIIQENPEIFTDELKAEIYEAARLIVKMEDEYIDKVFEMGPIESINTDDLKEFIRHRANNKLGELGLKQNWKNIDLVKLRNMEWFDFLTAGVEHQDFFANRVTGYSKGITDFSTVWATIPE